MNILILNWRDYKNPKSGGAELVTLEHAKAWIKKGHRITWFTAKFINCKDQETIDGINIVRRGNSLSVYLHALFFYFFSKTKFDLVVDEIHGIPFFTPLYVRKPIIAFIHEVADEIWDYMYPFPINAIARKLEPILFIPYRKIKFITVSDSTKKSLIKLGIKKENIRVILNGVTCKVLNTLPIKRKTPTFIFISRVVKMKGIEEVIRAFFYILQDLKDANLWIVGDGEKKYVEELKETMHSFTISPKVKFFGKVNEQTKIKLLEKSHLLLHASIKEGWGLVVIEAASQATPAIVYNVAGLRDSVRNKQTGIVLRENNSKEMAKEALNLLKNKNLYNNFQLTCLDWARGLTWKKSTQESTVFIESIVGRV